jgi:hypothetical protein
MVNNFVWYVLDVSFSELAIQHSTFNTTYALTTYYADQTTEKPNYVNLTSKWGLYVVATAQKISINME